jgi:cysteine desulfurase/selenocysteine lyase
LDLIYSPMDVQKIRKDFPILSREVNGRPLVYFDNAATSQTPLQVIDVITDYYKNYNANIHRGVHALSQEATDAYEAARQKIQKHFNAAHPFEIIFTSGTTHSINIVSNGYAQSLQKGDELIVSALEHHSNIVPWQMLCEKTGAILKVIPMNQQGVLLMEEYEKQNWYLSTMFPTPLERSIPLRQSLRKPMPLVPRF